MDVLYDFQSNRSQVKSAPVKSTLVKSAPSQIGLKMKVKSTESKRYLLWKARGIYNLQTSDFTLRPLAFRKKTFITCNRSNKLNERYLHHWKENMFCDKKLINGNNLRTYRKIKESYNLEKYLLLDLDKNVFRNYT